LHKPLVRPQNTTSKCWIHTCKSRKNAIEAYKIITGKEAVQRERLFELAPNEMTRGHGY